MDFEDAIYALEKGWSGKAWSLPGKDVTAENFDEKFEWMDASPKPTYAEIMSKFEDVKYIKQRAAEMPTIIDKVNALWDLATSNDSKKLDAVKSKIAEVESKYPAPASTQ